jgi:phosphate transport system substrate-binding protein
MSGHLFAETQGAAQGYLFGQGEKLVSGRGLGKEIVVVSRGSSSGVYEVWNKLVLNKAKMRPDAQLQASNGAAVQAVAGNKYAIGYVGLGCLNENIKAVVVDGITASPKTAKDKSYAVARALYMFTKGKPAGAVKKFSGFCEEIRRPGHCRTSGFCPVGLIWASCNLIATWL